ncbi:MAG: chalcone isomerase family protein [Pseudomonadota bacterium]
MNKIILILILLTFFGFNQVSANDSAVDTLPAIVSSDWDETQMIGETTLRKFGFHIYDASFWNLSKNLEDNSLTSRALMIVYARKIASEKLVNSTKKQWKDIGIPKEYPTADWLNQLGNIWPSVKKGDVLVALVESDGTTKFYSSTEMLGEIDDPEFGQAFLDIWIGDNTNYKRNRKELLNEK